MITLLGVGHVFDIGPSVRRHILQRGPSVVGLELDPARYYALTHRDEAREAPFLLQVMASFQERIAREYGGQVGDEMLAAAAAAREVGAGVALIDVDSRQMLPRLWRALPFEERVRAVVAIAMGLFVRKRTVERELERYEQDQTAYLDESHGRVVAVIGDGHVEGVHARLADREVEVVRLKDLRAPPPTAEFTFSFTAKA